MPLCPKSVGRLWTLLVGGLAAVLATSAQAAEAPLLGQKVYESVCAGCHAAPPPGSRASPVANLRKMSAAAIHTALTTGAMRAIGDGLSPEELDGVVSYLAAKPSATTAAAATIPTCSADKRAIAISDTAPASGWGYS